MKEASLAAPVLQATKVAMDGEVQAETDEGNAARMSTSVKKGARVVIGVVIV